jgi:hypothetical protein
MPRFFALVFLEHGQVRVVPPTIVVAFDLYRLDQYSFFRHDFVLAALAADFEGGGGRLPAVRLPGISCCGRYSIN